MEDTEIVKLYWARSEKAISETAKKYGRYCFYIANNILCNCEDSEECVNDTYWKAWGVMPPKRPEKLSVFLGKITRNLSINRYRLLMAKKRGEGQFAIALEELQECIPSAENVEEIVEAKALTELLNCFLEKLPKEKRKIFLRRYWYFSPVKEIALEYGISESKVKMSLMRTREELKVYLERKGVVL